VAQLTGLFGLYPCAFRTFEVDDLIFNISGLMAGFAVLRWWRPG
jgi:glycopeptide antibiotics resistance protein